MKRGHDFEGVLITTDWLISREKQNKGKMAAKTNPFSKKIMLKGVNGRNIFYSVSSGNLGSGGKIIDSLLNIA